MTDRLNRKRNQRGGTLALLTLAIPFFLIPLLGLAIDGSMLFIIQAKLSQAVDGAALGAGRLLGTNANSDEIAGEFLKANFPDGWWGTRNLHSTISTTRSLGTYTINVDANVEAPLLFMRILGTRWSKITAVSQSTRRDTRVVLVLDRSGSMDTTDTVSGLHVFTTMKTSAKNFVGMFTPGTDELGLVVYQGSAVVAYPTSRPYNESPTSAGGPDGGFGTSATAGVMINQINATAAGGATNISEAISLAYIELQKAHNRAMTVNGLDNSLNAIVLFTDGAPTALSINPNKPGASAIKSSSPCTYKEYTADATTKMRGFLATSGSGPNYGSSAQVRALRRLAAFNTDFSLTTLLQRPTDDTTSSSYDASPKNAVKNCWGMVYNGWDIDDLAKIPDHDYYGNSTGGTAYQLSSMAYNGTIYSGNSQVEISTNKGYNVGIAAWNATDNAGKTIRAQTAMNPVVIYSIGYTGNGGIDPVLLKRLANTLDAPGYTATQQSGLYFEVHSADQLTPAFNAVASDLLRLAR
jgi:Flp pilus assembly protein TadG